MITSPGFIFIKIYQEVIENSEETVNWSDIKDDVIPFFWYAK
jgi:hypothetical protein